MFSLNNLARKGLIVLHPLEKNDHEKSRVHSSKAWAEFIVYYLLPSYWYYKHVWKYVCGKTTVIIIHVVE